MATDGLSTKSLYLERLHGTAQPAESIHGPPHRAQDVAHHADVVTLAIAADKVGLEQAHIAVTIDQPTTFPKSGFPNESHSLLQPRILVLLEVGLEHLQVVLGGELDVLVGARREVQAVAQFNHHRVGVVAALDADLALKMLPSDHYSPSQCLRFLIAEIVHPSLYVHELLP